MSISKRLLLSYGISMQQNIMWPLKNNKKITSIHCQMKNTKCATACKTCYHLHRKMECMFDHELNGL